MKLSALVCLLCSCLAFISVNSLSAQDSAQWIVTGRVLSINISSYPNGSKLTDVTLASVINEGSQPGIFTVNTDFLCTDTVDCSSYVLGTCSKQTFTVIEDDPDGPTTHKITSCVNPHSADCWTYSGYLAPRLWATTYTRSYGCWY